MARFFRPLDSDLCVASMWADASADSPVASTSIAAALPPAAEAPPLLAAAGTAICALDKTKVILRLEANVRRGRDDGVALDGKSVERFDITEHILSSTDGDGAAAA